MTNRELNVSSLDASCESDGSTMVRVNLRCYSSEDLDDVIAWLELAKTLMIKWEEIITDKVPTKARDAGRAGGVARAASLSPEERSEIARDAANTRWAKEKQ